MNSLHLSKRAVLKESWLWQDWILTLFLFGATAAVVVWQNSRVGILWDLSYILENAYRISLGEVPYRDFPFPYPPLTFLVQAAFIKLTGRGFFHHILYCAAMGGLATVLTWRILLNILDGVVTSARLVAFLLSTPLIVLGIYCIFPHPFYDPDCTFAILLCLLLLQQTENKGFPPLRTFLTGGALVIPLLIKQNTGLAFLGSTGLVLVALTLLNGWHQQPRRGYVWLIAGGVVGVTTALLLIQLTAGLDNYLHWTVQFAASRRMPPLADMLSPYWDDRLPIGVAAFVTGGLLLGSNRQGRRWQTLLAAVLMLGPFIWTLASLFTEEDLSEPGERLLALWPLWLLVSGGVALWGLWKKWQYPSISLALPFILIVTVQGAFLSQQVWGSTYGIWPLLLLLVASTLRTLISLMPETASQVALPFAVGLAVSLLGSGGHYLWTNERLDYAKLLEGERVHSTLPVLTGLSIRGHWLADFEELVHFAESNIPRQDGLIIIPGEDLFYYTTGRHPQFPVVMFDHTINPYSPTEILQLSRVREIRWLVVKRDLQLEGEPVEDKAQLLELLSLEFTPVTKLRNYIVYRRNLL
jgi:hypothetical protein